MNDSSVTIRIDFNGAQYKADELVTLVRDVMTVAAQPNFTPGSAKEIPSVTVAQPEQSGTNEPQSQSWQWSPDNSSSKPDRCING